MVYPPVTQFETRAPALPAPVRVVVAEDCLLQRAGTARLLEDAGFDVVAEARDRDDLVRKVRGHRPDVVVMPADADVARRLRAELPGLGVLVLSDDTRDASALLADGAEGVG